MLVIRKTQMDAISNAFNNRFENRMFIHLRDNFGHKTATFSDSELRAHIDNGIYMAKSYGIEHEDGIQRYLELMMINGLDFDEDTDNPRIQTVLADIEMTGEDKIKEIELILHSEDHKQ